MRVNRPQNNNLPAVAGGSEPVRYDAGYATPWQPASAVQRYEPASAIQMVRASDAPISIQLADDVRKAELYAASGYFSCKTAEECFARMMYGRELGIGEVVALRELYSVNGRLAPSAILMGALIKRTHRYNYRTVEHTDQTCTLRFFEIGQPVGDSTFTMEDAKRAGVLTKGVWTQYPKAMLYARALSQGARYYCADAVVGLEHLAEELGASIVDLSPENP